MYTLSLPLSLSLSHPSIQTQSQLSLMVTTTISKVDRGNLERDIKLVVVGSP